VKLVVLGATGGTGIEVVKQALIRGHSVTAFVRSPERLASYQDSITIRKGDLLNGAELAQALEGHDAVISAFGPRIPIAKEDSDLLQRFAAVLVKSMREAKVKRVVVESVAFLFKNSVFPPTYLLGRLLFPGVIVDASGMEEALRTSVLDWTIIRPPELTDQPYTGSYRVGEGRLPAFGFKISRANVAEFMVKAAESKESVSKVFGVSN